MRKYQYKPLKDGEIRLIDLFIVLDQLVVNIRHIQLEDAGDNYHALSYVWGDPLNRSPLICADGGVLLVTVNLLDALRGVWARQGQEKGQVRLWVDAICINQEDKDEVAVQVRRMRDIYQKAERTVAYIGELTDDILAAVAFINHLHLKFKAAIEDRTGTNKDFSAAVATTNNIYRRVKAKMESQAGVSKILQDFSKQLPPRPAEENMTAIVPEIYRKYGSSKQHLFTPGMFDEHQTMASIVELLSRPYFQRAWIVQELVVSKGLDMYCGAGGLSLSALFMFFTYTAPTAKLQWDEVMTNEAQKRNFDRGLLQLMSVWELRRDFNDNPEYKHGLCKLLTELRGACAFDDRDKIYAFLGLATDGFIDDIQVDYEKSKEDVYTDVARVLLENGAGASLINEAARSGYQDSNLPSWVPDWSRLPKLCGFEHVFTESDPLLSFFKASGDLKDHQWLQVRGKVLLIKGVLLQTIVVTGDSPVAHEQSGVTNAVNFGKVLADLATFAEVISGKYPTGEDEYRVISKILEADQKRLPNGPTLAGSPEYEAIMSEMDVSEIKSLAQDERFSPIIDCLLRDPISMRNVARATVGRKFAMTGKTYAGLVPSDTKPGDIVCILAGFNVPYVLRKRGDQYRLIGDAYIHGMMQGELNKETMGKFTLIEIV